MLPKKMEDVRAQSVPFGLVFLFCRETCGLWKVGSSVAIYKQEYLSIIISQSAHVSADLSADKSADVFLLLSNLLNKFWNNLELSRIF